MSFDGTLKFDTKIVTSGFESGISKIGALANGAIKATTAILAGGAAAAIKVGSEFEAAMSNVAAISGATGEELDALTAKAQEMGAKTKFSAKDSADAFSYMAMAGWKTGDMLNGIEGIMNLAAASGEDLATTSDIVTDALTAFGLTAQDSGHFADVLAAASSNANTNVGLMGETFKYVAPVAGALGFSAEDTAQAIGLMANAGIKGSQAGTALRSVFTRLAKPTAEVQNALDALGVSMIDSQGNVKDLDTVMQDLRSGFASCTDAEKTQYAAMIAGQEGMSGLLAIVNASESDYNKLSDAIAGSTDELTGFSAAQEMAEKQMDNLQGQVTILKSGLEGFGIQIYQGIEDPLKDVVITAQDMVKQLSDAFASGGFEGLVSAAGDVLAQIVEKIAGAAPLLIDMAASLIHSFCESLKNSDGVGDSGAEIIAALIEGLLSVAGDLASTAIYLITELLKGLQSNLPSIVDAITNFLVENMPAIIDAGIQLLSGLVQAVTQILPLIIERLPEIIIAIVGAVIAGIPDILAAVGTLITAVLAILPELLTSIITAIAEWFGALIGRIGEFLGQIGTAISDWFLALPEKIDTFFEDVISSITTFCTQVISDAGSFLSNLLTTIGNFLTDLPYKIGYALGLAIGAIIQFGSDAIAWVTENVPLIIENIVNFFKELPGKLWQWLVETFNKVVQWGKDTKQNAQEAARNTIDAVINFFKQLPSKVHQWLTQTIQKVVSWGKSLVVRGKQAAQDMVNAVVNAVQNLPTKMYNIGVNIVKGVWNGIKSMATTLKNNVMNFFSGIVNGVKKSLGIHSPSTVFEKEVGEWIPPGVGEGVKKKMPQLIRDTKEQMSRLADDLQTTVQTETGNISFDKTGPQEYEQVLAERRSQTNVNVSGQVESDRPIEVHTNFYLDKRKFAEEITPSINHEMYKIDNAENKRGRGN